jgi:hypothetical protein
LQSTSEPPYIPTPEGGGFTAEFGNAAATVLLGKKVDDKPARSLVSNREQVVEGTVVLGRGTLGLLPTGPAATAMERNLFTVLVHNPLPPLCDRRGR